MDERITVSLNGFLPEAAGGAQVDARFSYDPGLAPVSVAGRQAVYEVVDPDAVVEVDGIALSAPEIRLAVSDNLRLGSPGGPSLTLDTLFIEMRGTDPGDPWILEIEPAAFVGGGQDLFSGTALPVGPYAFDEFGESTLTNTLFLPALGSVPLDLPLTDFALGAGVAQLTASEARLVALLFEIGLDRDGRLNPDGINHWIDFREAGGSEEALAAAFLRSDEFAAAYGAPETLSDREFVERLFLNGLDRAGAEEGIAFWTGRLADGASREGVLIAFADSFENRDTLEIVERLVEVAPGEWDLAG